MGWTSAPGGKLRCEEHGETFAVGYPCPRCATIAPAAPESEANDASPDDPSEAPELRFYAAADHAAERIRELLDRGDGILAQRTRASRQVAPADGDFATQLSKGWGQRHAAAQMWERLAALWAEVERKNRQAGDRARKERLEAEETRRIERIVKDATEGAGVH